MIKNIIKYIDKIINPQKYYTNNITKKIKKLQIGDKLYALYLPNIEHMSISKSLHALNEVKLTTPIVNCLTKYKQGNTYIIDIELYLYNPPYEMINGLMYQTDITQRRSSIIFTIKENDVNYTIVREKYNGYVILTTNKNIIKSYLKKVADIIKYRIIERVSDNEQNKKLENTLLMYNQNGKINYENYHITNFKKQYAKILNQLRLL